MHHVAATFMLLQNADLDIFKNFSKDDYKRVRHLLIMMVLSTDMSSHFTSLGKLNGRLTTSGNIQKSSK